MIKKYPWNEPDESKRSWNAYDSGSGYNNRDQVELVLDGNGDGDWYGNIDDLNPELYDYFQMRIVSRSRGTDKELGNIDHLDPELYNHYIFEMISLTGKINAQTYKSLVTKKQYQKTLKTIKEKNPEWLI